MPASFSKYFCPYRDAKRYLWGRLFAVRVRSVY